MNSFFIKGKIGFKKYYAAFKIFVFIFIFFGPVSCKKFVSIDPPPSQVVTSSVFSDDQDAISAINGLYSQMMQFDLFLSNGGITIYTGLTADEILNENPNEDYDPLRTNSILPSHEFLLDAKLWGDAFKNIYHCNAILEGIINSNTLSSSVKNQLSGEAKFIRSFFYFYLVNLFGDVPLATSTDYNQNASLPRIAKSEVYQKIITDLKEAQQILNESYPTPERVRPNKMAVTAFLARVYLYNKDWTNAEQQTSSVINSGLYSLETDLNNVFLDISNEAIFQLLPVNFTHSPAEANLFVPSSSSDIPQFSLTNTLLNSFEAGDQRETNWVASNTVSGQTYFYPFKYKVSFSPNATEYNMVLRLAEQYLIRAEAKAQQSNIIGALADINAIRIRAGLSDAVADTQAQVLSLIEKERQVELFAEWGHRWFDLIRTNRTDPVLSISKAPTWQLTDTLFPIPEIEIRRNPFLTQNPGY